MMADSATAIVLAAGLGTRMRSARPKVLHEVAHRPMLGHVLAAVAAAGIARRVVVVGPDMKPVEDLARGFAGTTHIAVQRERRGTGHAALVARDHLGDAAGPVIVLFGDTPLLRPETLAGVLGALDGADLVALGFRPDDPTGYGRLVTDGAGALLDIREDADASAEERRIGFCFSGVLAVRDAGHLALLDQLTADNAQGELYLTDLVGIARDRGLAVGTAEADAVEVMGVNSRAELAAAEAAMQGRLRAAAMAGGVTMQAPETVFLAWDTHLAEEVTVGPHVWFGPGVSVGPGAVIRAYCHIEEAAIAAAAQIGPFARIRPGTEVGEGARVGNFVEVKNATIGAGAKLNHLSYVGDAAIGAHANLGAGTITCNYDGFAKHITTIGEGAFIGSNTALVAPVTVGAGAYVGSGSVITLDVEPDALAVARGRQVNMPDGAKRLRARRAKTRKAG